LHFQTINLFADETISLTPWTQWTPCSVTCGGGLTSRYRQCTDGSYECGIKMQNDQFLPLSPLLEFKSCSYNLCPNEKCTGALETATIFANYVRYWRRTPVLH